MDSKSRLIIGQIKSGKFSGREGGLSICDIFWVQRRKEGMGGGSSAFVKHFRFKLTLDYRKVEGRERILSICGTFWDQNRNIKHENMLGVDFYGGGGALAFPGKRF